MQVYGNEITKIYASVEKINNSTILMQFDNGLVNVPKSAFHSKPEPILQKREMEIDTWFLRRNRIIPITD